MSPSLKIVIFLLLLTYYTCSLASSVDNTSESFFKLCPPTRCSNSGPIIRYPFRLNTQPTFCGREGYELSCSADNTVFPLLFSGHYYVKEIYYPDNWISLTEIPKKNSTNCPIQSLSSFNSSGSILEEPGSNLAIANCSERIVETEGIYGPIDCLTDGGGNGSWVYVMDTSYRMDRLPLQCSISDHVKFASVLLGVQEIVERLLREGEIIANYRVDYGCLECERAGRYCGFNSTSNETICSSPKPKTSSNVALIVGISIGGTILLALAIFFIYKFKKSDSEKETELKIEKFLESYKTLIPTRYSFSEIKKITSRFKKRLGQGGYGSVYHGKLPKGIPVAVKVLENSKGNEEEFINEVTTISRIHHFNIVRLVGFCYEGTWRALVFEFLPNGSLDKFLFSEEGNRSQSRPLNWKTLQQIATGIAHGIEYLHQGCNQRILHFDIKPHNILLDQNFQPKISDFGLAKVCATNQSVVSMTRARGTEGYMAPELFSRNFGEVSYKSDVYSFGMLLLQMVGYRRNEGVSDESEGQIYFPERIYDRMSKGMELGLQVEMDGDEEIGKKLALVGLWCIQWSPTSRPNMTRVVQMLEGDLGNLEMPPRPFLSSDVEMVT